MGYVADASTSKTLRSCRVRSPSATSAIRRPAKASCCNAQPFLIDCAHGQIAIAHNGNLVNARELRDELVRAGLDFPDEQRHRSHFAPVRAVESAHASKKLIDSVRRSQGAFSLALLTKDA